MNHNFDIYVINLDKDVDRLETIEKALKPNHFIRIQGILGNPGNGFDNDVLYTSRFFAPRSAVGCSLSHRKALATFLQHSKKEYALILEDDATPTSKDYMTEVGKAIDNAPKDWAVINLDSWPHYSKTDYTALPTLLKTAYIVNRPGAKKWLDYKVVYYPDVDMCFYNMRIYNSPTIVFEQIWDEKNGSNNKTNESYNPLTYLSESFKFKMLRLPLVEVELTMADLTLITAFVITATIVSRNKII